MRRRKKEEEEKENKEAKNKMRVGEKRKSKRVKRK
jgi:hypothetical protein